MAPRARSGPSFGTRIYLVLVALLLLGMAIGGPVALVNGLKAGAAVDRFRSAIACPGTGATNCFADLPMSVSNVNVSYTRSGESDSVRFLVSGREVRSTVEPANQDSSILRTGAGGTVRIWEGRYTDLFVAGRDFPTTENPEWQRNDLLFAGSLVTVTVAFITLIAGGVIWASGGVGVITRLWLGSAPVATKHPDDTVAAEPSKAPELPLVIRPSGKSLSGGQWLVLLIACIVIAVVMLGMTRSIGNVALVLLAVELVVVFAAVTWRHLYVTHASLFVTSNGGGYTDYLGRPHPLFGGDVATIAFRLIAQSSARPYPVAILVGRDSRCRLRLSGRLWSANDIRRFAAALGVGTDGSWSDPATSAKTVATEIRGGVPVAVHHGFAIGIAISVVIVVVILVGFAGTPHTR